MATPAKATSLRLTSRPEGSDTIHPTFYVRGGFPDDFSGASGETPSDEKGFRAMTPTVDLMGRLSNPPEAVESVAHQGGCDTPPPRRTTSKGAKRSSNPPEPNDLEEKGQLSNPTESSHHGDDGRVDSPTAGRSMRRPGPPVLRRLTPPQIEDVVAGYQSGRSLIELAQEFGIHHRTVAGHLERLGVARRVNLTKMSPADRQVRSHPLSSR